MDGTPHWFAEGGRNSAPPFHMNYELPHVDLTALQTVEIRCISSIYQKRATKASELLVWDCESCCLIPMDSEMAGSISILGVG